MRVHFAFVRQLETWKLKWDRSGSGNGNGNNRRYGEPVCVPLVDQFVHSMASFGAHVHTALK